MPKFILAVLLVASSFPANARLQCVPYARSVSGIDIHGNAETWWDQAEGNYTRGHLPKVNSVLVFQSTRAMPLGHVAVVREILDERRILLDHANWSRPGMIEHRALAIDVSEAGDWSEVRVWYSPISSLGSRSNPAYGFIYNGTSKGADAAQTASVVNDASEKVQVGNLKG